MKRLILFLSLPVFCFGQDFIGPMTMSYDSDLDPNETGITLILSSVNAGLGVINTVYFMDDRRRSNAGFYVFPGLLQVAYGVSVQEQYPGLGTLNIAVGSAAAVFSAVRLLYRSRERKDKQVFFQPRLFRQNKTVSCGIALMMRL